MLMATRVTDVHGNYVDYDYDSSGRLTRIEGSDGRQIDLSYSGSSKLVQSVSAHGRTWTYTYQSHNLSDTNLVEYFANKQLLDKVTQPDGKFWSFDLENMFVTPPHGRVCYLPGYGGYSMTVTHPYGVTGTFEVKAHEHRRALSDWVYRPGQCTGGVSLPPPPVPSVQDMDHNPQKSMAVTSKTLTGPSVPTSTWTFEYESDVDAPHNSSGPIATDASDPTNWTKVVAPDGSETTYYHFWNLQQAAATTDFGGKMDHSELRTSAGGSVLQSQEMEYITTSDGGGNYVPNSFGSGTPIDWTLTPGSTNHQINTEETFTTRGSDTYTTVYAYETNPTSSQYDYGSPYRVTATSSTASGSRITDTDYHHDTGDWILSLPDVITRNGKEFVDFTYNGDGLITEARTFGSGGPTTTYSYHPDGNLHTLTDPIGRVTTLTNYKRGAAQDMCPFSNG